MATKATDRRTLDEVLRTLSCLKGVKHSFYLDKDVRKGLARIEKAYPPIGPLAIRNDGVLACLKKEHVACIVKDKSFRAPPHPTVLLVNEDDEVIGRELLPGERIPEREGRKTLYIGKDFVIFIGGPSGKGANFVLPPVRFLEVEKVSGVTNVISSSPSTLGDLAVRKQAGLKDDPKLATILIGFDLE
jgi:hypothetical protein